MSTEIDTINNINTTIYSGEQKKKRGLEELTQEELEAIKRELDTNNTPYVDIARQYNLTRFVFKDFQEKYNTLATQKQNEAIRAYNEAQREFIDTEYLWTTRRNKRTNKRVALDEFEKDCI